MNRSIFCLLTATAVAVLAAPMAFAQVIYDRALTAEESWANGRSNVIRARGQYQIDTSEARRTDADTRSVELDNRLKSTQTYFEGREVNRQQRFGDYADKKRENSKNRMFRYGQEGRPKRPNSRELDPITGKIRWPLPLMDPWSDKYRKVIDDLFKARAFAGGQIGYENYERISRAGDAMLAVLKKKIREIPPQDYVSSKNFIKRLLYEARHPTG